MYIQGFPKKGKVRLQSNKGFTLMELIIVILIMAVIATLFTPSMLQRNRIDSTKRFASEITELVEGIKRYYWANDYFPSSQSDLLSFMNISNWPSSPIGGTLSYTNGGNVAILSLSNVPSNTRKYLNIIDRIVPFSSCDISTGSCQIEIPETAVYIDQEIKNIEIVDSGEAITTVTCDSPMTPSYMVSVLYMNDPEGYGIVRWKTWIDSSYVAHLSIVNGKGDLIQDTDASGNPIGKLLIQAFCH